MNTSAFLGGLLALGALSVPLAAQASIHVLAQIDGRSRLVLVGDTAQWQHFDFAAPGRIDCDTGFPIQPTQINGADWWPSWPDLATCENRDCGGCTSDVLAGIAPVLPNTDYQVLLNVLQARGSVAIVEYPDAANGYRVVLEFNDNGNGGADWYEVDLSVIGCGSVSRYCTSTPNSTGMAATISVAGSLSVAVNDLHLLAFQCPPTRPGLFLYGAYPTQIPFADGYLCISPFYPGLHRAGPAALLDANGTTNRQLDLQALPAGGPILGGSTWNFQFWYRDLAAGGSGSNLTDAMSVTFCP
jgi:hypothetical protein